MTQQQQPTQKTAKLALREAVYAPAMLAQFARALPKGFPAEKMAASIELAVANTPALANCELQTVLRAALAAAEFGWSVHWGPTAKCALVPFGSKCQLVVGYRGYIDLMSRSPECKSIHADVVREGDVWRHHVDHEGVKFKHQRGEEVLNEKLEDTRPVKFAYAVFYYKGGGNEVAISTKSDFEKVKRAVFAKMSAGKQAESPYTTEPWKMWRKRALRILANLAPMTGELQRAIELEAEVEAATERDMGEAQRVDLSGAQPLPPAAALPEPRAAEVIEPAAEREAVPVERKVKAASGVIADESQGPDWSDEDESRIAEWESAEGEIPDKAYRLMYASVQRMKGTIAYAALAARLTALAKRRAKKTGATVEDDEPGSGG